VGCTLGGCHRLGVSIQGHTDRGVSQQFLITFRSAPTARSNVEYVCRKVCHPMRLVIPSFSATGRMSRRISCCPQYGFFPPLLGLANTQCCASL